MSAVLLLRAFKCVLPIPKHTTDLLSSRHGARRRMRSARALASKLARLGVLTLAAGTCYSNSRPGKTISR